uniref:Retrotransposon protein, putative, Ty3-gypsy subclass n=1 Tax=Oryza sativa subsp. japonica TaxID=39947 RepID=Q2RBH9_ORYSJ|nr:retrotransposon protein, putative, Ty3-gypsy subclass [Oryza sativa Japonica Group]
MDSPATPVGLSPPLLSLVLRNEPCYTKEKEDLLRQRLGFRWTGRTGDGSRDRTAEIDPFKTNGRDRTVHDRLTGEGDDDVGDDVTTGGGGSDAQARRRMATLRHERRTPTGRAQRGELTGDQSDGGRGTDGTGGEVEAAAVFGLTAATVLRRSTTTAKGRTRTATTWRSRRRSSRATTMTGTAAAHGWSDGGARAHGARALRTTRGEGEGGGG